MDNKIIETFLQAYEELDNLKGRSFEFSKELRNKIYNQGFICNMGQYINEDNSDIEVSISPTEYERYILLKIIMDMIQNEEIELKLTDKATDKNINYLNKLVNSLNEKLDN